MNNIELALEDLKLGKPVIVVDDESRENEGDLIVPSQVVTPEAVNFLSKYGRGLVCVSISASRAVELDLQIVVPQNSSSHQAAFTISVDSVFGGSGISVTDRCRTIKALVDKKTLSEELARPGHIFPLVAHPEGLAARRGHTEASVELAKLCGFEASSVLCEVLDEDGEIANMDYLEKLAKIFRLRIVSVEEIANYQSLKNPILEGM